MSLFKRPYEHDALAKQIKRDQTKLYIDCAKDYVEKGKSIYARVERKTTRAQNDVQKAIDQYASVCGEIAQKMGQDVTHTINRFNRFHVDSRIQPRVSGQIRIPALTMSGQKNCCRTFHLPGSQPNFILSGLLDTYQHSKAKAEMERARDYWIEARATEDRADIILDALAATECAIRTDTEQLQTLWKKVSRIISELDSAMDQASFTPEHAAYLTSANEIAGMIRDHITSDFLKDDGTLQKDFKEQSAALREINAAIPAAPSVDDQKLLFFLRNIKIPVIF